MCILWDVKRSGDTGIPQGSTSQLGVAKTSQGWLYELPRNLGLGIPSDFHPECGTDRIQLQKMKGRFELGRRCLGNEQCVDW